MSEIMRFFENVAAILKIAAEAGAIRVLHIFKALDLRFKPGLCPPQCANQHTYRWPCRARRM